MSVRVTDPGRIDEARTLLQGLNPTMTGPVLSVGGKEYDMTEPGGGVFTLRMTDAYKTQTRQQVMDQSIEVVRRRIDELGTARAHHRAPGRRPHPGAGAGPAGSRAAEGHPRQDRQDDVPAGGRTGRSQRQPSPPIGDEILPMLNEQQERSRRSKIVVQRRVMVSGDRLTDASQGFDQQTGAAGGEFPLRQRRRAPVRRRHQGAMSDHRFAIVLDKQVITAPVDPRADPGRLAARSPAASPPQSANDWPSCCAPARCPRR